MKKLIYLSFIIVFWGCTANDQSEKHIYSIDFASNAFYKNDDISPSIEEMINWNGDKDIELYFYMENKGDVRLFFNGKSEKENSLQVIFNNKEVTLKLDPKFGRHDIGSFEIKEKGYQKVIIKNLNHISTSIVNVEAEIDVSNVIYSVPPENSHFGKRGPSTHWKYVLPYEAKDKDIKWYYSEIEVPQGQDVIGSYYMANGFGQGYFGIQVNSEKERRILFSVWSPFETDNPDYVPDGQKIKLLGKGKHVYTGKFGNEGSGGQSYLVYPWKAAKTYGFLLKGEPIDEDHTQFSAYFHDQEKGEWLFIASFSRPKTHTYLTNFYSFLENFIPSQGNKSRMAFYKNQWVMDKDNKWYEVTDAEFSADATARQEHRFDYQGGLIDGKLYLRSCGFFDNTTAIGLPFKRESISKTPPSFNPDTIENEVIQ
ncbi:DUF3472 domain-containing protein [Flammeovirga sp. MY04]|uniref:DUF3472 domain-containing protein n=1 Tax=Flammeovirga sp. MY04 TaxID=1191459 RepID=UPI0008062865|nr:DUF3472 domain-containing protein [Flammeovirga sp. MY04]ANQ48837.1 DUF3472 domain-containing protein [Flammeovirga sp. MY04]